MFNVYIGERWITVASILRFTLSKMILNEILHSNNGNIMYRSKIKFTFYNKFHYFFFFVIYYSSVGSYVLWLFSQPECNELAQIMNFMCVHFYFYFIMFYYYLVLLVFHAAWLNSNGKVKKVNEHNADFTEVHRNYFLTKVKKKSTK